MPWPNDDEDLTGGEESTPVYYQGQIIGYTDQFGDTTYLPATILSRMFPASSGGSSGSTWKPGEYDLEKANTDLAYAKYQTDTELEYLKMQQDSLDAAMAAAAQDRNTEEMAKIAQQQAVLDQRTQELQAQQNEISLYSTQLSAQGGLASTYASVAQSAAETAANPRNYMEYLNLVSSGLAGGSALPMSYVGNNSAANEQYQSGLAKQFQDEFGNVGSKLEEAWGNATTAPAGTATPQNWYESMPSYQAATPTAQAYYKTLPLDVQQTLARATPQEAANLGNYGKSQQSDVDRYKAGIAGKTPEEIAAINRYLSGLGTPSMAGGGKMTINEPVQIIGSASGKVWATAAETAPEQITITPLKKEKPQSFAEGGTINMKSLLAPGYLDRKQPQPYGRITSQPIQRTSPLRQLRPATATPATNYALSTAAARPVQPAVTNPTFTPPATVNMTDWQARQTVSDIYHRMMGIVGFEKAQPGDTMSAVRRDYMDVVAKYPGAAQIWQELMGQPRQFKSGGTVKAGTYTTSGGTYYTKEGTAKLISQLKGDPGLDRKAQSARKAIRSGKGTTADLQYMADYGGGLTASLAKAQLGQGSYATKGKGYTLVEPSPEYYDKYAKATDASVWNPSGLTSAEATGSTSSSTSTTGTDTTAQGQLALQLQKSLNAIGVNWTYVPGSGQYAPPTNVLVGDVWNRIKKMPTLYSLLMSAYSASGQDEADVLAEQKQWSPTGVGYGATYNW